MDPFHAELMTMASASDIFAWLEATKELEDALTAAMGDPRSLRGWAHIPDSRFEAEVEADILIARLDHETSLPSLMVIRAFLLESVVEPRRKNRLVDIGAQVGR